MPGPRLALIDRGETMNGDECRRLVLRAAPLIQRLCNRVVIGLENLPPAAPPAEASVRPTLPGIAVLLADLGDPTRHRRVAVAVDHEARIKNLADEGGIERIRKLHSNGGCADIIGDVPLHLLIRNAELTEALQQSAARHGTGSLS